MKTKRLLSMIYTFIFFFVSCGSLENNSKTKQNKGTKGSVSKKKTTRSNQTNYSKVMSSEELRKTYNLQIPQKPKDIHKLPPQKGARVQGKKVELQRGNDLPWTAFTLVLYINKEGEFEVLTQKRRSGEIETAGGHLRAGQTFAQGAADELKQESGISVDSKDLIFQTPSPNKFIPRISKKGFLYFNSNFFVVYKDKKPKTNNNSHEIDRLYGHKWVKLKTIYREIKEEQNKGWNKHGKYYSFFRSHLIHFCETVLPNNWKH